MNIFDIGINKLLEKHYINIYDGLLQVGSCRIIDISDTLFLIVVITALSYIFIKNFRKGLNGWD